MTNIDHGNTFVVVREEKFELKFNLKAVKLIDTHFNGLVNALQSVQRMSPQAVSAVITFGAGLSTKQKDVEALEWEVIQAGTANIAAEVTPYLLALLNPAAKSPEEIEAEAESGNE